MVILIEDKKLYHSLVGRLSISFTDYILKFTQNVYFPEHPVILIFGLCKEIWCANRINNAVDPSNVIYFHNQLPKQMPLSLGHGSYHIDPTIIFFSISLIYCMLLSSHIRVSEWTYTLLVAWMSRNSLFETGAVSK